MDPLVVLHVEPRWQYLTLQKMSYEKEQSSAKTLAMRRHLWELYHKWAKI